MKRDYSVYLRDILQSFRNASQFVEKLSHENFITDRKTVSAVIRELEIAGEATKQLLASIRRKYPDIPWSDTIHNKFLRSTWKQADNPPITLRLHSWQDWRDKY